MQARTHTTGAMLLGATTFRLGLAPLLEKGIMSETDLAVFFGAIALGALLPDIDHPQAKLGRKFPITSWLISRKIKHRTLTHSLLSIAILSMFPIIGLSMQISPLTFGGLGLVLGHSSHIALDMLTRQGVALFYPKTKRYKIANLQTGSASETVLCAILISLTTIIVLPEIQQYLPHFIR